MFIDESGSGKNKPNKNSLWMTAGICCDLELHDRIVNDLDCIKQKYIGNHDELKGSMIPRNLLPGKTADGLVFDIGKIISKYEMEIWLTGTVKHVFDGDDRFIPSNPEKGLRAWDVARGLLLRLMSDSVRTASDSLHILIWDLTDVSELIRFSKITSSCIDQENENTTDSFMIPNIIGGLSHDWAEIQIADIIANLALNYFANGLFSDADIEKSNAFKKYILPYLNSMSNRRDDIRMKLYGI